MTYESSDCVQSDTTPPCFFLVRGRAEILKLHSVLVQLSGRCGQTGAMDYLEYFLSLPENTRKIPYLVVIAPSPHRNIFELQAEDMTAVVLVYEYKMLGVPSRVFSTSDFNGIRALIAPRAIRSRIAAMVCRYLTEQGAHVVLLSWSGLCEGEHVIPIASMTGHPKLLWTTQSREVGASLRLEDTLDATLARLGSHTRRNLRYYRRKAEAELACSFETEVRGTLTKIQLAELNRASTHPVIESVLDRRFDSLKGLPGGFCAGVRSPSGEWLSLMAGRRHHGVTEIDWQANRGGFAKYSIGTVVRAFLIEHEIAIGSKRLFFEGGTPHTLRHSFVSETASDMIAARPSLFMSGLCGGAKLLRLRKNYLLQVLVDPALRWDLH